MIRRALGQVAHILDISARRIDTATDDRVAAGVGVVGAVEEAADRVVGSHLGGGQEGERRGRCESDGGGGETHLWGVAGGCCVVVVGRWDVAVLRGFLCGDGD